MYPSATFPAAAAAATDLSVAYDVYQLLCGLDGGLLPSCCNPAEQKHMAYVTAAAVRCSQERSMRFKRE